MRNNFRIKVDLSKFFKDHRKNSYVFVDTSQIFYIKNLKEHIAKLFDIRNSFFLMCESTYLPSNEDVRILQNDNFVTLLPGTLMDDSNNSSNLNDKNNISLTSSNQVSTFDEKEVQTVGNDETKSLVSLNRNTVVELPSRNNTPDTKSTNTTVYHTVLEESETSSAIESRSMNTFMTEDYSMNLTSPIKRRRHRRRKTKRQSSEIDIQEQMPQEDSKKPKIINTKIIATGKHIRFNQLGEKEFGSQSSLISEKSSDSNKHCDTPYPKKHFPKDLSSLLALKQCSTPLNFASKRIKKAKDAESEDANVEEKKEQSRNLNEMNKGEISSVDFNSIDPKNLPSLSETRIGDIIAFKIHKMGDDYTPQISDFIIGKLMDIHPTKPLFKIKILHGTDEVKEPRGKFALPEDEEDNLDKENMDVLMRALPDLIDPRLLLRTHNNK